MERRDQSRSTELAALIDEAPSALTVAGGNASRLRRLCDVAVRIIPASAAAVTVEVGADSFVVLASAGLHAEELEELQITLGEGPCVDAGRRGRPVLESDLACSGRQWPAYGPAAGGLGVAAVFAFPLHLGATHLGVLDVYQPCSGELSDRALLDCLLLADIARGVLLDDPGRDEKGDASPRWDDVLPTPELYQAQGMLMIQLGADPVDALARIRAHAYAHDERLGDVARDIVRGRLTMMRDER